MKYTIQVSPDGHNKLFRYGEYVDRPNNAELEFWFRIQELEEKIEAAKQFAIIKAGHRLMQVAQPFRELVNKLK